MAPIAGCIPGGSVSCYQAVNNSTYGLGGIANYITTATTGYSGISTALGGSVVGLLIIVPLWFIIFIPLMLKGRPMAAFTAACFICLTVSTPLVLLHFLANAAWGILLAFTVIGAMMLFISERV